MREAYNCCKGANGIKMLLKKSLTGLLTQPYLIGVPLIHFDELMISCFCGMVDQKKAFRPYFQPEPLSEIFTISDLRHAASRV